MSAQAARHRYLLRIAALICILIVATGCSSGRVLVARVDERPIGRLAVMIGKAPLAARPERIEMVLEATEEALRSRGYSVVDRERVLSLCPPRRFDADENIEDGLAALRTAELPLFPGAGSAASCTLKKIDERFNVDAIVRLNVNSLNTSNFLIGYIASISADLSLLSAEGVLLEQVMYRESENSGVLGNSGQVVQAISSQASAFSGESFKDLSGRFARGIASKLKEPVSDAVPKARTLRIAEIAVAEQGDLLKICVDGSSGAVAEVEPLQGGGVYSLLSVPLSGVGGSKSPDPARYCGSFRFFPLGQALVRLSDSYGVSTQRSIDLRTLCRGGGDPKANHRCQTNGAVVFGADSRAGPYTRIGVIPSVELNELSEEVLEVRLRNTASMAEVYAVAPRRSFSPVSPRLVGPKKVTAPKAESLSSVSDGSSQDDSIPEEESK